MKHVCRDSRSLPLWSPLLLLSCLMMYVILQGWAWTVLCTGSWRDQLSCHTGSTWRKGEACCEATIRGGLHSASSDGWNFHGECFQLLFFSCTRTNFCCMVYWHFSKHNYRSYSISLLLSWKNLCGLKERISTYQMASRENWVSPFLSPCTKHQYHRAL